MTDTTSIDPFTQTNSEQVNPVDYVKTKFAKDDGEVDWEGVAKGKYEADKFIETLQRELEAERQKATQGLSYKELLEEIKRANSGGEPNPITEGEKANPPTMEELQKLVQDTISKTSAEQREAANKAAVVEKLNSEWGTNVSAELAKRSRELGISVKRLEEIGKESPQALFNMLGISGRNNVPGSASVPTSRNVLPSTNNNGERTKKYYDNLYRQNPSLRYDSKTAAQEHRDAIKLGAAFFD